MDAHCHTHTQTRTLLRLRSALALLILPAPLLIMACGTGGSPVDRSQPAEEDTMDQIVGDWQGALDVSGQQLPLVFHITRGDDGLTATMDSPAQGAAGIPVDRVSFDQGRLELSITALGASYDGTLREPATEIVGTFKQAGMELDLTLSPAANRPQEPRPPFPYVSVDVTFMNQDAGVELAGTITHPEGEGPFPAAVLISGSGQQNRNEELFGHKPFLVLSDALTRSGIAVLRYDDRGVGGSGGAETVAEATSRDFAGDAAYALQFLMDQPYVDADRAGLIGHSEGALIAAMIAAGVHETPTGTDPLPIDVDPGFVVMLGGEGVPGDELLMMQSAALLRASGAPEEYIHRMGEANREVYDILLSDIPREDAAERIAAIQRELGMNEEQIQAQRGALLSPWFDFFLRYDPADALRKIQVPVLAVIGELDRQVPAEQNIPEIREALRAAPTRDFTVRELAGLNHLLQPARTGGVEEYQQIEVTMSPEALELISGWITERFVR